MKCENKQCYLNETNKQTNNLIWKIGFNPTFKCYIEEKEDSLHLECFDYIQAVRIM